MATSSANSLSRKPVKAAAWLSAAAGAAGCAVAMPGWTARPAARTMAASVRTDPRCIFDMSVPPT